MTCGSDPDARDACRQADDGMTRVFGLLGKRWTGLIVAALTKQPAHYAELRRAVPGISERMLSDRLTELATAGLVLREVDAGPPLRVTYCLTESGKAIEPALRELLIWSQAHLMPNGDGAPAADSR
ncbi:winged helix-turn-helix transcriptional regulator [Streptomyces sp. NPDC058653]|uniref:winged helix-turn-helix transcriptional regulator n=1 Tax=Streptomyces sp. NPDC058653 TaxID=3346576 RepID=UPI003656455F